MRSILAYALATLSLTLTACPKAEEAPVEAPAAIEPEAQPAKEPVAETAKLANCQLTALGDSGVKGTVTFTLVDEGVKVSARVEGLKPKTVHGFHIHEKGDCSSPDGKSAGGHFNPTKMDHAGPGMPSHIGDLGNLEANDEGIAILEILKKGATMGSGESDIIGRGMIIHAKADDLKSQPTGAAGPRIACGVIEAK